MNQSELVIKTAQISGLPKTTIEHALKVAGDVIVAALTEGGEATIPGLGKLIVKDTPARVGRNPRTGEPANIPAHNTVKFRAAKALKDAVA